MKRQIYVVNGNNPATWCEGIFFGPFDSEAKARKAIHQDAENSLEGCGMLSPGVETDFFDEYHLLEYIKGFNPTAQVDVAVTLHPIDK